MYHPVDYWAAVLFRKWVARDGARRGVSARPEVMLAGTGAAMDAPCIGRSPSAYVLYSPQRQFVRRGSREVVPGVHLA